MLLQIVEEIHSEGGSHLTELVEQDVLLAAYEAEKESSSIRPCFARALGLLLDRTEGRALGRILEHRNWWLATESGEEIHLLVD